MIQFNTQTLLKKYAPHITTKRQLQFALDCDELPAERIWNGESVQIRLDMLKRFVIALGVNPGEITLAEFFSFDVKQRKSRSFERRKVRIADAEPFARLRARELCDSKGIETAYQLMKRCEFSHITAATRMLNDPRKISLDHLETLILKLGLNPAATSLADVFDFGEKAS